MSRTAVGKLAPFSWRLRLPVVYCVRVHELMERKEGRKKPERRNVIERQKNNVNFNVLHNRHGQYTSSVILPRTTVGKLAPFSM